MFLDGLLQLRVLPLRWCCRYQTSQISVLNIFVLHFIEKVKNNRFAFCRYASHAKSSAPNKENHTMLDIINLFNTYAVTYRNNS